MFRLKIPVTILICFVLFTETICPAKPAQAKASEQYRYFPETDQAITEPSFLEYWENNGGLSRFGYPIDGGELEDSTLAPHQAIVQYFERAEFERYSRHGSPEIVALTLLGTLRYKEKYRGDAPDQKPNLGTNSVLVPETGKRIGGRFLQYWQSNGSVAQLGYPLSDEIQEVSELDGKEYTMQYFERAVMEWHPDNNPPNDIQLSHLGRMRFNALYGPPDQLPANARVVSLNMMSGPVLSSSPANFVGYELIYLKADKNRISICSYDFSGNKERVLGSIAAPHTITNLIANEKTIAWVQDYSSIHVYDRVSGTESLARHIETDKFQVSSGLAIDKDVLYYRDNDPDHLGLFKYELHSQHETLISTNGSAPFAIDGILLFTNLDNGSGYRYSLIMMKNEKLIALTTNQWAGFSSYKATSKYVVWTTNTGAEDRSVYLYNIGINTKKYIASSAGHLYMDDTYVALDSGYFMIHNPPPGGTLALYNIKQGTLLLALSEKHRKPGLIGIIDGKWLLYAHGFYHNQESQNYELILYAVPITP